MAIVIAGAVVTTRFAERIPIARLIQIALDLKDDKGTPLCRNVLAGGVTIDSQAQDRQATDATSDPPELLFVRSIAVTD